MSKGLSLSGWWNFVRRELRLKECPAAIFARPRQEEGVWVVECLGGDTLGFPIRLTPGDTLSVALQGTTPGARLDILYTDSAAAQKNKDLAEALLRFNYRRWRLAAV